MTPKPPVYLDWAATAIPDADIVEETARVAHEIPGNPSSRHQLGRQAADVLADCRKRVAAALEVAPADIVFTGSATESNSIAVGAQLHRKGGGHIVVSDREHPSLGRAALGLKHFGFDVTVLNHGSSRQVTATEIIEAIREDTVFVGTTLVESSTGEVLDVRRISDEIASLNRTRKRRIFHHCDCVQALGKIPFRVGQLCVDSASMSAHKIAAPRGAAVLYHSRPVEPLFRGGGQESDIRPGTENLPAIYGMTLAVERYGDASYLTTAIELESRVRTVIDSTPGATLYPASRDSAASHSSDATEFSPFIISFQVPPIPGEVLARVLSDAGVAVSRGSACAENLSRRGTQEITHVVRVSTGYGTSNEDIAEFGRVLAHVVKNMRGDLMRGDPS